MLARGLKAAHVAGVTHLLVQRGEVPPQRTQQPRHIATLVAVVAGLTVAVALVIIEVLFIACHIIRALIAAVHRPRDQVQLLGRPAFPPYRRLGAALIAAMLVPLVAVKISTTVCPIVPANITDIFLCCIQTILSSTLLVFRIVALSRRGKLAEFRMPKQLITGEWQEFSPLRGLQTHLDPTLKAGNPSNHRNVLNSISKIKSQIIKKEKKGF